MEMREGGASAMEAALERLQALAQKDHDLLTQLDMKVGEALARLSNHEQRFTDFETRIRELESAKWRVAGVAAKISSLIPIIVSLLTTRLAG